MIKNPITDYTREDIIELLESGRDYNNYSFCKSDEDNEVIVKFKDGVEITNTKEMIIYTSYNEDKQIITKDNIALVTKVPRTEPIMSSYIQENITFFKDEKWAFECLSKDKYNGLECVKVRLTQKIHVDDYTESWWWNLTEETDTNYVMVTLDYWISLESGLVAKTLIKGEADTGKNETLIYDYKLQLNTVTDDDVKLPDLQGYEVKYIDN